MADIPKDIEQTFLRVIRKELSIQDFENWVYQTKQLEHILPVTKYFNLISLDFRNSGAWANVFSLLKDCIQIKRLQNVSLPEWVEVIFYLPSLEYVGDIEYFALPIKDREKNTIYLSASGFRKKATFRRTVHSFNNG